MAAARTNALAPANAPPASSERAFAESYLDAAAGRPITLRTSCATCHPAMHTFPAEKWNVLSQRSEFSRAAWAEAVALPAKCGICHVAPDPAMLPRPSWHEALAHMKHIIELRGLPPLTAAESKICCIFT